MASLFFNRKARYVEKARLVNGDCAEHQQYFNYLWNMKHVTEVLDQKITEKLLEKQLGHKPIKKNKLIEILNEILDENQSIFPSAFYSSIRDKLINDTVFYPVSMSTLKNLIVKIRMDQTILKQLDNYENYAGFALRSEDLTSEEKQAVTESLKQTILLLCDPSPKNIQAYHDIANTLTGKASPHLVKFGLAMLGISLALAVTTLITTALLTPAAPIALFALSTISTHASYICFVTGLIASLGGSQSGLSQKATELATRVDDRIISLEEEEQKEVALEASYGIA